MTAPARPDATPATTGPAFSLLCSAYRCERYLAATIESVIAQTCPDWELIVVDNGPSDSVAEIVRRFTGDPRIRLIRQTNSRLVGGIATASAASSGRYLVPLDSDDELMPTFCTRMRDVLDARPEIDALSCDVYQFLDGQRSRPGGFLRGARGLDRRLTVSDLVGQRDTAPYFAAFRREAWFAADGYAPGTDLVEDIALYLRLVAAGRDVRILPERLARYRIRADSASGSPSGVEAFDLRREEVYVEAARATKDPETLRSLRSGVRRLRYERALREARRRFAAGDMPGARQAVRDAHRQRATVRSTAVLTGLAVAPGALRRIRPAKHQVQQRVQYLVSLVGGWRESRARRGQPGG
jgi:glycosyltransferase involved in cell wall biosynthesis